MMLTIHGLPIFVKFQDLKKLIRDECKIFDFILDNLVIDDDGVGKKIRVGLADEREASVLMQCLDGYRMTDTNTLSVVLVGKPPPNIHGHHNPNQEHEAVRTDPWQQPSKGPWVNTQQGGVMTKVFNQYPPQNASPGNSGFHSQRPQMQPKPFGQREVYPEPRPGMPQNQNFPFQQNKMLSSPSNGPPNQSLRSLRNVDLDNQREMSPHQQPYMAPHDRPTTISKDKFQGPTQFAVPSPGHGLYPTQQVSPWNQPKQQQYPDKMSNSFDEQRTNFSKPSPGYPRESRDDYQDRRAEGMTRSDPNHPTDNMRFQRDDPARANAFNREPRIDPIDDRRNDLLPREVMGRREENVSRRDEIIGRRDENIGRRDEMMGRRVEPIGIRRDEPMSRDMGMQRRDDIIPRDAGPMMRDPISRRDEPMARLNSAPIGTEHMPIRRDDSMPIKRDDPMTIREDYRMPVRRDDNMPIRRDDNMPTRRNDPIPIRRDDPIPIRRDDPIPIRRDDPVPIRREDPMAARRNDPAPIRRDDHIPLRRDDPMPIRRDDPMPIRREDPMPIRRDDPMPIRREDPMSNRRNDHIDHMPIRRDDPMPIRREDPMQMRRDANMPRRDEPPSDFRRDMSVRDGRMGFRDRREDAVKEDGRVVMSPNMISPGVRRASPGRRTDVPKRSSPSRGVSPGRRSPHRYSPTRVFQKMDRDSDIRADMVKQVRPAYEPVPQASKQPSYSGYHPKHKEDSYASGRPEQRPSWHDRDKTYPPKSDDTRREHRADYDRPDYKDRSRSPARRYKQSPSRSPRRSWALEKRPSPLPAPRRDDPPPPPAWPDQRPPWRGDRGERGERPRPDYAKQYDDRKSKPQPDDFRLDDSQKPSRQDYPHETKRDSRFPESEDRRKQHEPRQYEEREKKDWRLDWKSTWIPISPAVKAQRDKVVEVLTNRLCLRHNEKDLRVRTELKIQVSKAVQNMYGTKDVTPSVMLTSFDDKYSKKDQDAMFEEVMASLPGRRQRSEEKDKRKTLTPKEEQAQSKSELKEKVKERYKRTIEEIRKRILKKNNVTMNNENFKKICEELNLTLLKILLKFGEKYGVNCDVMKKYSQSYTEIDEDHIFAEIIDKIDPGRKRKREDSPPWGPSKLARTSSRISDVMEDDLQLADMEECLSVSSDDSRRKAAPIFEPAPVQLSVDVPPVYQLPVQLPPLLKRPLIQTPVLKPVAPVVSFSPNQIAQDEPGYHIFLSKAKADTISSFGAAALKDFIVSQIFEKTASSGWAPTLTFKEQSGFHLQHLLVATDDYASKNWLLSLDFSSFHSFKVVVRCDGEEEYERAAVWLPGHCETGRDPLHKLSLQNKGLDGLDIDRWKLVKQIVTEKGIRIYVDIAPSSVRVLEQANMMLSYELQKVNVFLRAASVDKNTFDEENNGGICAHATSDEEFIHELLMLRNTDQSLGPLKRYDSLSEKDKYVKTWKQEPRKPAVIETEKPVTVEAKKAVAIEAKKAVAIESVKTEAVAKKPVATEAKKTNATEVKKPIAVETKKPVAAANKKAVVPAAKKVIETKKPVAAETKIPSNSVSKKTAVDETKKKDVKAQSTPKTATRKKSASPCGDAPLVPRTSSGQFELPAAFELAMTTEIALAVDKILKDTAKPRTDAEKIAANVLNESGNEIEEVFTNHLTQRLLNVHNTLLVKVTLAQKPYPGWMKSFIRKYNILHTKSLSGWRVLSAQVGNFHDFDTLCKHSSIRMAGITAYTKPAYSFKKIPDSIKRRSRLRPNTVKQEDTSNNQTDKVTTISQVKNVATTVKEEKKSLNQVKAEDKSEKVVINDIAMKTNDNKEIEKEQEKLVNDLDDIDEPIDISALIDNGIVLDECSGSDEE